MNRKQIQELMYSQFIQSRVKDFAELLGIPILITRSDIKLSQISKEDILVHAGSKEKIHSIIHSNQWLVQSTGLNVKGIEFATIFTGREKENSSSENAKKDLSALNLLGETLLHIFEKDIQQNELNNQKLFLDSIINKSPVPSWISDNRGLMIRCNDSFVETLSVEREKLIGKYNIYDDPNFEKNAFPLIDSVYKEGKSIQIDLDWKSFKNGKTDFSTLSAFSLQLSLFPILDTEGTITHAVCQWIDMSEQKTSMKQLKSELDNTNILLDAFLENNPIYVFFKDKEIRSIKLSRNFEEMLGLPLEELIGKSMYDLFPSDLARSMIEDDKRILEQGKQVIVEEQMQGRYFETLKFPIYINGKADYLAGFTHDITQRKKAEQALLESNRQLAQANALTSAMMDESDISIWAVDKDYKIIYINHVLKQKAQQVLNIPLEIGHSIFTMVPEDLHDIWKKRYQKVFAGESIQIEETSYTTAGEQIMMHLSASPIILDGKTAGAFFTATDITEIRQSEKQQNQSRKLESLGQLAGGVAHNFNNMLSAIMGCTELLRDRLPQNDKRSEQYCSMILESSERAADLAGKLLTFSKPHDKEFKALSLNDLISTSLTILNSSIDKKINLDLILQAQKDRITGDASLIQSVIMNLGINAAQAITQKGMIRFHTENKTLASDFCSNSSFNILPGEYICLKVSDTGPGIKHEVIDRIFDPFFTTKDYGKGTGLGLSTALGTMQQHGGSIEVESQPGKGTSFTLLFPLI